MARCRVLAEKVRQNVSRNPANRTAARRETTHCWFLGDPSNERVHARPKIKAAAVAVKWLKCGKGMRLVLARDSDVHQ
jgi:hypothetical protein